MTWGVGRGAWDVGRGTWDVGRGTWDVGRGTWDVGRGTWDVFGLGGLFDCDRGLGGLVVSAGRSSRAGLPNGPPSRRLAPGGFYGVTHVDGEGSVDW
jgi:hypothetical protein